MAIRPFDFDEMYRMFDEMDRLFEGSRRWDAGDAATTLTEEDGEYVFVMDMPGFETEDIDLRFDDGFLLVSAVHEHGDADSVRSRRVERRIGIADAIRTEDITAEYRNGVLEVRLPMVEGADDAGHSIDIRG